MTLKCTALLSALLLVGCSIEVVGPPPAVEVLAVVPSIPLSCPGGSWPSHVPPNDLSVVVVNHTSLTVTVSVPANGTFWGTLRGTSGDPIDFSVQYPLGCSVELLPGAQGTLTCAEGSVNHTGSFDDCYEVCPSEVTWDAQLTLLTDVGQVPWVGTVRDPVDCFWP